MDLLSSETSGWLQSTYSDFNELHQCKIDLKLLLPLTSLSFPSEITPSTSISLQYQSMQLTSSRILYYSLLPSLNLLPKTDLCTHLRQMKFPQAYALFLKDLSRLIKPTSSSNLSIDLIWELMPDVDEHQRLLTESQRHPLEQQQNIQIVNQLIPDIWGEIGERQEFSIEEDM